MLWRRPCDGCKAKDGEIHRLLGMLAAERQNAASITDDLLQLGRDAAGLTKPEQPQPTPPDPMPSDLKDWLDARFTANSPMWRHQMGQARKLLGEGKSKETIVKLLVKGQEIEL